MWLKKLMGRKAYQEANWEEIPDEDLWEDGELIKSQVEWKITYNVLVTGKWKLIREVKK
jgi:hypothetical protein